MVRRKQAQYANLGRALEVMVETANAQYAARRWARIEKVNVKWTVQRVGKRIVSAFPAEKSTVDFMGIYNGRGIAFDAKETRETTLFPLKNIEPHQMDFLRDWQDQGGISFFLIEFVKHAEIYFVPFDFVDRYWQAAIKGGRKSIPYDDIRMEMLCAQGRGVVLDYLKWVKVGR